MLKILKLFHQGFAQHKGLCTCALLLGLSAQAITLIQPALGSLLITRIQHHEQLTTTALVMVCTTVLWTITTTAQQLTLSWLGEDMAFSRRLLIINSLISKLSLNINSQPAGWHSQRLVDDVDLMKTITPNTIKLFQTVLLSAGSACILLQISPSLFLYSIFIAFSSIFFTTLLTRFLKRRQEITQDIRAHLVMNTNETLSVSNILRAYNMLPQAKQKLHSDINKVKSTSFSLSMCSIFFSSLADLLARLISIAMILYGAYTVTAEAVSLAQLVALYMYFSFFLNSVSTISNLLTLLGMAHVGEGRIKESTQPEIISRADYDISSAPFSAPPKIQFRNTSARYPGHDIDALSHINFTAESGKLTALVGETGSGKTTCLNLIESFIPISDGFIFVDDIPLASIDIDGFRSITGYVDQDATMLTGTIRHNLTLDNKDIHDERIIEALNQVGFHGLNISNSESFLQMHIRSQGDTLSGGQQQQIAIARALLGDPKILLLDEPTAHLDSQSESDVQTLLKRMRTTATVVYATHKYSLASMADWIVVVKNGCVIDQGTHHTLLQSSQYYRKMAGLS